MFDFLFSVQARRRRLLGSSQEGPLKQYLSAPLPDLKSDIYTVPLLALDFETSGLKVSEDSILSVGYVAIDDGEIRLSTACHHLVKSNAALPEESVVIHKITDDASAAGELLEGVIGELLQVLSGKVIVAHNAKIETTFLSQACQKLYGVRPHFPAIDTMLIAKRWMEGRNKEIGPGDLRLFNLRKRYGLPIYRAHNALSDAIATAELLQAQIAQMDSDRSLPLKQFII